MKRKQYSPSDLFKALWQEGFFKTMRGVEEIETRLEEMGYHFESRGRLTYALLRTVRQHKSFLTKKKTDGVWRYIQGRPTTTPSVKAAEEALFDDALVKKLGKPFEREIEDLHINFGKSGNCTAFLLRKVLEKLIYITFAKNKKETLLEDKTAPGRLVGLETMIETAAREKVNGTPFLTNKTAQEIKGIKFLGDTSAHNPFTDVDMKTILPQMPFIVTAYKELSRLL